METPSGPSPRLVVTKIKGCTMVNQYLVVQYLGRGTSGKVFLCMDVLDRRLYAVKIVKKTPSEEALTPGTSQAGSPKFVATNDQAAAADPNEGYDNAPNGSNRDGGGAGDDSPSNNTNENTNGGDGAFRGRPIQPRGRVRKRQFDPIEDLRREIAIMRGAGVHRNVVALREVVDDPSTNKMLIVMEYCEGGPVMTRAGLDRGRKIPEEVARPYFRDMLTGLAYLHSQRVIHGDLKPENALMAATGRVLLSDFGCSKILPAGEEILDRCNGTPAFLAPEMMHPGARYRGRAADVYGLGVCLFTFLFGRIPFLAGTIAELFEVVRTQELSFPDEPEVSPEVKALLQRLLEKNPDARYTLVDAAMDPWTTDGGRLPPAVPVVRAAVEPPTADEGDSVLNSPPALKRTNNARDGEVQAKSYEVLGSTLLDGDEALNALIQKEELEVVKFKAGQWLVRQGDRSNHMFYVLRGHVEVLYCPSEIVLEEESESPKSPESNEEPPSNNPSTREEPTPSLRAASSNAVPPLVPVLQLPQRTLPPAVGVGEEQQELSRLSPFAAAAGVPATSPATAPPSNNNITDANNGPTFTTTTSGTQEQPSSHSVAVPLSPPVPPLPRYTPRQDTSPPRHHNTYSSPSRIQHTSPPRRLFSGGIDQQPSGGYISPRRLGTGAWAAVAASPEPSPRMMEQPGSLSSSFHLSVGATSPNGAGYIWGQSSGISAVTTPQSTPGMTPLPSARDGESISTTAGKRYYSSSTPAGSPSPEIGSGSGSASASEAVQSGLPAHSVASTSRVEFSTPRADAQVLGDGPRQGEVGGGGMTTGITPGLPPLPSTKLNWSPPKSSQGGGGGGTTTNSTTSGVVAPATAVTNGSNVINNGTTTGTWRPYSGSSWAGPGQPSRPFSGASEGSGLSSDLDSSSSRLNGYRDSPLRQRLMRGTDLATTLAEAAEEALGFTNTLKRENKEYLLALRGEGDFLGETALIGGSSLRRSASLRSKGDVKAVIIPYATAKEHFKKHPLAKQRLAELVWARQSETIVLECLLRFGSVATDLRERTRK